MTEYQDTQSRFYDYFLSAGMGDFIDYDTASASFDDGRFADILNFCASLPRQVDYSSGDRNISLSNLKSGKLKLYTCPITSPELLARYNNLLGDDELVPVGCPNADKKLIPNNLTLYSGIAISSSSPYRDQAWDFAKLRFNMPRRGEAPLTKSQLSDLEQSYQGTKFVTTEYGMAQVPIDDENYDKYPYFTITDRDIAAFRSYIDGVAAAPAIDTAIYTIISEEVTSFFAGTKTADQTAQIINSRVNIYLSEQHG